MPQSKFSDKSLAKHTLYITFDGLSDPLGQSQIIPYLRGISSAGYAITVLSCEKKTRLAASETVIKKTLAHSGIEWTYLLYDEGGGIASRLLYMFRLHRMAERIRRHTPLCLVHCRSYLAALIGLRFKLRYRLPFLFDMRGFWADERIDGAIWSQKNPLHRLMYRYFKNKEAQFLSRADAVVSLTEKASTELLRKFPKADLKNKIMVIPCCCDTELFRPPQSTVKKANLLVYTGSIGTWYLTRELLECVNTWRRLIPDLKLMIITKDVQPLEELLEKADPSYRKFVIHKSASHTEIPMLIAQARASIFFIRTSYSKIASSPTKMAESWAMDLPIITNKGIGDNDRYFSELGGGVLLDEFNELSYENACRRFLELEHSPGSFRQIALQHFDTRIAIERYQQLYQRLCASAMSSRQKPLSLAP